MVDETYVYEVNSGKLLHYLIKALSYSESQYEIVKSAFDAAIKDFCDDKLDIFSLSSFASAIYFEISSPTEVHNWRDSYMTSLIGDLYDLGYYAMKAQEGDEKAKLEVERVTEKAREYLKRIQ